MKLLIIEDCSSKRQAIKSLALGVDDSIDIYTACSVSAAYSALNDHTFDLIILDLILPLGAESKPVEAGDELLKVIRASSRNFASDLVALTAFNEIAESMSQPFSEAGVIVANYNENSDGWKSTVTSFIRKSVTKIHREFVVLCALAKERSAFGKTRASVGSSKIINGLDGCDIEIDGFNGVIILCPRMGLVNSAIITTLAVERFGPRVICMAGICAGFKERSQIGQVLIPNPCFEYQVGKYTATGFEVEQYQNNLDENLRQKLASLSGRDTTENTIYGDVPQQFIERSPIKMAAFASGSAVVSDSKKIEDIMSQHRKLAGIDMEVFGFLQSAQLMGKSSNSFAAKAVVDFADEMKGDQFHETGAMISARFCVEGIATLLKE